MTHAYPFARGAMLERFTLVAALIVAGWLTPPGPLPLALGAGIAIVLAWGALTLHFPTRIDLDDDGVAFRAWGRAHRFAWTDVARVRVRRFLVKDRVLVRIDPSSAWRGRYWVIDSIDGFDALVRALDARALATTRAGTLPATRPSTAETRG